MMQRFDILKEDTPIFGHRLLEASAGTGKTFAIENLVFRLLMHSFKLEEILVVTFTKAAARELKMRICKNLHTALHKPSIADAYQNFEKAQIFTIHSFCLKMLREFAFETKINLTANLAEEDIQSKTIQFTKNFLLACKEYHYSEMAILMRNYGNIDKLVQRLLKLAYDKQGSKSFSESYQALQKVARESLIKQEFVELFPNYKITGFNKEDLDRQIDLLSNLTHLTAEEFGELLNTGLSLIDFLDPSNLKKNKIVKTPPFFDYLKEKIYPIVQEASSVNNIEQRLAKGLRKKLNDWYDKEGILTPDLILQKMQRACDNQTFLSQVKKKYKAVIIDEFQDTDPIQWDVFQKLFLNSPKVEIFYLVGDPKQSIYGFRNADVYTYLQAAEFLGSQNHFSLDTNYRSTPTLIGSLNAFFSKKAWLHLPKIDQFLDYIPVKAGLESKEGPPLHFFLSKEVKADELFFLFIAKESIALQEKGIDFSEITVLVKDRYQGQALQAYLKSCQIPSIQKSSQLITETIAFKAFSDYLKAVLYPNNSGYIRATLIGPFFNFKIQEVEGEISSSLMGEFFEMNRILQKEGIPSFLAHFLKNRDGNLLQDLQQVVEFILQHGQKKLEDFLEELKLLPDENLLKPATISENAIQIMTIHASKGLEFSAVFALGLAADSKSDSEQEAEKLRQLYVAMTRAKNHLYVPLGLNEKRSNSPIHLFFGYQHDPELSFCDSTLKFLDDLAKENKLTYSFIEPANKPIFEQEQKQKLNARYSLPVFNSNKVLSFSMISKKNDFVETAPTTSNLPRGPEFGTFIHAMLEEIVNSKMDISQILKKELPISNFSDFSVPIAEMLQKALYTPLLDFCLADVSNENIVTEMEFFYPLNAEYLKGFIDILFFHQGKYFLLDWKTNDLNDYSLDALHTVLQQENYFLQASIYTQALQRYLALIDPRPFKDIFGGMFYVFLRGITVYHFFPEVEVKI